MIRAKLACCLIAVMAMASGSLAGGEACQREAEEQAAAHWRPVAVSKAGRYWFDEKGECRPLSIATGDGALSPDGKRVALLSSAGDGTQWGLYVREASAQSEKQVDGAPKPEPMLLVSSEHMISDPVWSPDGKWIAYTVAGDGWSVWRIGVEAPRGEPQRLSEAGFSCRAPAYLPDGRLSYEKIVKREGKAHYSDIVLMAGDKRTSVVESKFIFGHAWSPDGTRLAYGVPGAITIVDVSGTEPDVTLRRTVGETHQNDAAHAIAWRPDGLAIATAERFIGGRMVGTEIDSDRAIFVYSVRGGEPAMLIAPYETSGAAWGTAPAEPREMDVGPPDAAIQPGEFGLQPC